MSRDARCTYGGKVYTIPEIWLIGIRQGNPDLTIADAIAYWAWMADLDERDAASR